MNTRDVIIIGSGPAGFTAAIYAARAGLKPLMIEGEITAGGALMDTVDVENYPGFPEGIIGPDLMEDMREQAERFGTEIISEDVTAVDFSGQSKKVSTDDEEYFTKAVILATGSAYRELGIAKEKVLTGRGVSYCATCDAPFFRNKKVVVVGGGDSAAEEALFLSRFCEKVKVLVRKKETRATKVLLDRMSNTKNIEIIFNTEVREIIGKDFVEGVQVKNNRTLVKSIIEASGIFVAIGHDPRSELFADPLNIDINGCVIVEGDSTRTNINGVFACGDLVDGTYRQAITAAGSGCKAALDAEKYLVELTD